MKRQAWIVIGVLGVACGASSAPQESSAPVVHDVEMPAEERGPINEHLDELAARLEPCREDRARRWPGPRCRQAIRALVAGCGTADLRALQATDRVTPACKAALWKLLPARDSHRSRLLVLGTARTAAGLDLYVTASDAAGEPASATLAALQVQLEIGGQLALATATPATALPARCDAPIFAASSILDYSGSMSDHDIDASIEVFRTLYAALPAGCFETEVLVFSDDVRRRHAFTSDPEAMLRAVARDDRMPRSMTALVDALGDGTVHAGARRAPVRLLLVATDGRENASTRWTYPRMLQTARAGDVRILSFGSLLSDAGFLARLGAETGGFFIYRADARLLAEAARGGARLLAATRRIRITDARLAAATHVVIGQGPDAVRLAIR